MDYSKVAGPPTRPTSSNIPFTWPAEAERVFLQLKRLFVCAPVLLHHDSSRQFVLEVDASESGVGAVLSQRHPDTHKLHPCAFFSRRLSVVEQNYDVVNRQQLAIVLALQEWRHWLEGAKHSFLIRTDHKNLAHVRSAKRLNSHQDRWSLFPSRFNFLLSY